ncbi:MAG: hypothetical protein KDA92_07775 [Planctomycetales bacterium]|nr:hypothetical protein [Planctomycetales bacterium]
MKRVLLSLTLLLALPVLTHAAVLQFDFGGDDFPTDGDINNVFHNVQDVEDAIDIDGNLTGISLMIVSETGFNEVGPNRSGPVGAAAPMGDLFVDTTTQDNLFGHSSDFNAGAPRPLVEYLIEGLDKTGNTFYDFTFSAGRLGVSDNRETEYQLQGAFEETVYLDVANNESEVAIISNMVPDTSGALLLTIQAGPNNTNGDQFFYLGGLQIESHGGGGGILGDFNGNGSLDAGDIDLLSDAVRDGTVNGFDLDNDGSVTNADRLVWIEGLAKTYVGDSNLDGEFNSSDFVVVFTAGQYEDGIAGNSTWASGDWNGDREFDSSDFVAAFSGGGFEQGQRPAVAAVPEPAAMLLALSGLAMLPWIRKRGQ